MDSCTAKILKDLETSEILTELVKKTAYIYMKSSKSAEKPVKKARQNVMKSSKWKREWKIYAKKRSQKAAGQYFL